MGNPTRSRLLALPAELRNRIYELTFEDHIVELGTRRPRRVPGLLLACQQMYSEARSLYYSESTFIGGALHPEWVGNALSRLPFASINLIKTLVLEDRNCAFQAQSDLFVLRRLLRTLGAHDLAERAQATLRVRPDGQVVRSSTPWQTYCAGFADSELPENNRVMSEYFQFKHGDDSMCWMMLSPGNFHEGKCHCGHRHGRRSAA